VIAVSKYKRSKVEEEKPLSFWNYIPIVVILLVVAVLFWRFTTSERVDLSTFIEGEPFLGDEDAKVTVVEFSDFECSFCKEVQPILKQIVSEYNGDVKLVFKNYPIVNIHPQAMSAAEASECAHDQGKFWEYHDKLYENQGRMEIADLKKYADEVGLTDWEFVDCLVSGKKTAEVSNDFAQGVSVGVEGTPTFFINGIKLEDRSLEGFKALINAEIG